MTTPAAVPPGMPAPAPVPELLYKYRSGSARDLDTLARGKIYVPSFHELNDIFENDFQFALESSLESENIFGMIGRDPFGEPHFLSIVCRSIPAEEKEARREQIKREVEVVRAQMFKRGVYCLSRDPRNQQLWAHYSSSHEGYCIEYRIPEDTPRKPLPVVYQAQPHKIDWAFASHFPPGLLKMYMIGIKHENWKYEEEWRRIYPEGGMEYDLPYPIESIILGFRSSKEPELRRIFQGKVPFKRVIKAQNFQIDIVDAN